MSTVTLSHDELARVSDVIQAQDFDCPFTLAADGTVTGGASGPDVFAPSVFHDEESDVWIDGAGWEPLTGMTGQYGYHGAVMHASEVIAGSTGIVRRMLEYVTDAGEPQTFVIVSVEVFPENHAILPSDECPACGEDTHEFDECYPEPAGWAILHYVGTDSDRLVLPDGTVYEGRLRRDEDGNPVVEMATCGTCGFTWNDALGTSITPCPGARTPCEYSHRDRHDGGAISARGVVWLAMILFCLAVWAALFHYLFGGAL